MYMCKCFSFLLLGEDFFSVDSASKKTQSKPKTVVPVSEPPPPSGTLSPDSDELFNDDPLFGGAPSKPSAPAPAQKKKQESTKHPKTDVLFASSPEPEKSAEDEDDLFSSSSKPPAKPSPQISRAEPAKSTPPLKKEPSSKVAAKKQKTDGLFGGSDESEDDLFSAPKPKKSSQPKPTSKPATKAVDELFSDDPLEGSTLSQPKPKPASKQVKHSDDLLDDPLAGPLSQNTKPKSVTKVAKPSDDLFSDPLAGSPPPPGTKSKPVTKVAKPSDDLFSDPLAGSPPPPATKSKPVRSSDSLFSDDPLATSPPPDTRPKPKSKPVEVSDDLFDDPLATSQPPETKPKPTQRQKASESDDLFSEEPEPEPKAEIPVKKKPAGAVSLFGGIDPFAAAGKNKVGVAGKSHDKEKPSLSSPSAPEKKDDLFGKKIN